MKIKLKKPPSRIILIGIASLTLAVGLFPALGHQFLAKADIESVPEVPGLTIYQENSLAATSSPENPEPEVIKVIYCIITAYSSTPWQTDDTPFITAAGTEVRNGIIANNLLPFGTRIRIPELYGDKIFVVEDRMNSKKSDYHFDIWFEDNKDAENFGAKMAYIEILEN
jgi:3D (Asp-Asp-Asp) domain-containing protein